MRFLAVFTLLVFLGASLYYAFGLWIAAGEADMPGELYFAMALGVVFSLIVGCGLMALMFYSSRRGYDERASGHDQHLR